MAINKRSRKFPLPNHTVFLYDVSCPEKQIKETEKVFKFVCELGCEIIRFQLEQYDAELAADRDKSTLRNKGLKRTTIKTPCGEVEYRRRVYQTKTEDGTTAFVYLLDEAMHMEKIGLISTNLAERIAMLAAEAPYRVTAETISETCGQSISHAGAWNLIQQLGERISEEEEHAVKQMEADQSEGEKVIPILFEEMDGVCLRMKHRRMRWSEAGANNMAKVLYRKENRELIENIERYTDGLIFTMQMQEVIKSLSAAKAPKKDGKGNVYVDLISAHMPLMDAMQNASRKAFTRAFCY